MEAYDTSLIGSLFAYPAFAQRGRGALIDGKWQIPTAWQARPQNGKLSNQSYVHTAFMLRPLVTPRLCYRIDN